MTPRLSSDESGAAAVEFALLLPLFMVLVAGLFDGARLIGVTMQVHAAAAAGAAYAQAKGWDAAGVASAVQQSTPVNASAAPAPVLAAGCVVAGAIQPPTNGACPNGVQLGQFLTVSAQAPFSPIMPWPSIVWPTQVTAHAVVRLQ